MLFDIIVTPEVFKGLVPTFFKELLHLKFKEQDIIKLFDIIYLCF